MNTKKYKKRNKKLNRTKKKALSKIHNKFESANIKILKLQEKNDVVTIKLTKNKELWKSKISKKRKKYENWFYFKLTNCKNKIYYFDFVDMNFYDTSFIGFNVCYSYDNKTWLRTSTKIKKNRFQWKFTPKHNKVWFAYYPPYTNKMNNALVNKLRKKPSVKHIVLGKTPLKNRLHMLQFGKGDKNIFIVARQHPGETIGSWMMEGFLNTFFSTKMKEQRNKLLKMFTFRIVPIANPDGVDMGNWYTQSQGYNLNREWQMVTNKENKLMMDKTGYNNFGSLYLDLHGDEGSKRHFITQCSPNNKIYKLFNKTINKIHPHFQLKDFYKKTGHTSGNHFGEWGTYDCKWQNAMTIEGQMKHPILKHKTLQDEPLKIGESIFKTIFKIRNYL